MISWTSVKHRIARALRPPRTLRPTRAGWVYSLICFGVGFAALNTGNNLLYLLFALFLGFLVFSGIFSEAALRGVTIRRRLPEEFAAEQSGRVIVEISNHQRRFPAFAVVVEDLRGEALHRAKPIGRVFALRVGPGETVAKSYLLVPERRGTFLFCGFRASTRFPFGLFSKSLRMEDEARALIYPAIDRISVDAPSALDGDGDRYESQRGEGLEITGLRAYATGDSLRRIHWRHSLRRGALLLRSGETEESGQIAEVTLATAGQVPGERFEGAIRRAASEVVAHLAEGRSVGLSTDDREWAADAGPQQRRRLLSFLAEAQPASRNPAVPGSEAAS